MIGTDCRFLPREFLKLERGGTLSPSLGSVTRYHTYRGVTGEDSLISQFTSLIGLCCKEWRLGTQWANRRSADPFCSLACPATFPTRTQDPGGRTNSLEASHLFGRQGFCILSQRWNEIFGFHFKVVQGATGKPGEFREGLRPKEFPADCLIVWHSFRVLNVVQLSKLASK